jgi:hypothetical protein
MADERLGAYVKYVTSPKKEGNKDRLKISKLSRSSIKVFFEEIFFVARPALDEWP